MEEVFLQHRNNVKLSHPAGQRMIKRFLGVDVTQLTEWQAYRAHFGRRKIWSQLTEAASKAEEGEGPGGSD
jgi:hypothetical protein